MEDYNSYDEKDLLRLFALDNSKAFEAIYKRYYLSVFRFAKNMLPDSQAAEDITTETFLKIWDKKINFESLPKLESFLFTTVRNACRNWLRDEKRHAADHQKLVGILEVQTEMDFMTNEITEKVYIYLQDEINKLPFKSRSILRLQLLGLKNQDIAKELGMAEKTVRNLKSDALKLLRFALLKDEFYLVLLLFYLGEKL
ncbi:MAG: sigma-70 family RNA polymerase sigma factor [Chitinophagaceae bacterium]|nr:sigma-70 family RNA polymerase sigma factor [Chitinophagaceae bacterium]MBK8605862.1 sigma-70 family RNA polymerase sigma factor [Chitinophagaceae bacterium]MBP6476618.1 sigma-70 family RNA polymerase sigma factor [Chitinophagaceae bacterium]MBP7108224.1 sigma-70 family RNA polymerase sigma factor [Chitinophagaceae bacterium]MBP7314077.1 sigma-70 family RNA polymerase sigma factor [Chitinophagaceae bacterium]